MNVLFALAVAVAQDSLLALKFGFVGNELVPEQK
jgi:hypothetical protein